jgi:hypothetical protein
MISDGLVPAHILRLYVWQILQEADALDEINGKVPLIPLEDEPELSDAGMNYIIYGYSENEIANRENIRQGVCAFRVIAQNSNDLSRITAIISRAFENQDIATEAVNIFSTGYGSALHGLRFTAVKTLYVESATPSDTEGGPVDGAVTLAYRYINHLATPVPESVENKGMWV